MVDLPEPVIPVIKQCLAKLDREILYLRDVDSPPSSTFPSSIALPSTMGGLRLKVAVGITFTPGTSWRGKLTSKANSWVLRGVVKPLNAFPSG